MQDPIGIDIKSNFDLWNTTWSRRNIAQIKTADFFIVFGHFAFSLQNRDRHSRLIISSCRESLLLLRRDCRIALDKRCHDAAKRFDSKCKWNDVEQENILDFAS